MLNDYYRKDHLGSIMQITDKSGAVVESRSYDAWGSPRDPQTGKLLGNLKWLVGKGYTGHEHLPEFRLVNMQGRLYDPVLCRFLSPDPYVQEPDNSQNLNRYSYCFNNPLAYTDPSGLWIYENGNYYTEDKSDIARLLNFLNAFGAGSLSGSTIRGFAASEITTGQQFAFYRYGMEGPGGQKIDHYVYLTGFTVYRSLFGQFTVDKSSFNRMIAARNKFMDDFSGVGSLGTWDPVTDQRIKQLDPRLQGPATDFINAAQAQGVYLRITQGFRTFAEQNALYAQGRTTLGGIVTNAKGGESYHNYRLAFDVVIMQNGKPIWDRLPSEIGALGISFGFEWGGNWRSFKDYPHFQMVFGQSISDLQKR